MISNAVSGQAEYTVRSFGKGSKTSRVYRDLQQLIDAVDGDYVDWYLPKED